jgi:hypothetical protein
MIRSDRPYVAGGMLTIEGYAVFSDMERRIEELEAKLAAVVAVADATGGATIDAEARAELVAIKGALA